MAETFRRRGAIAFALLLALSLAPPAEAQVADELRTDHVYVDPQAELADQVDANVLRQLIGDQAIYVAVLPQSAVQSSPGRTLVALRQQVGEQGRYALAVGNEFRTLPAEPGEEARAAHPDDLQAALTQFVEESDDSGGPGGLLALVVLIAVLAGGVLLLVNRRRTRERKVESEARRPDVNEDFVRLGDGIRAAELDVSLSDNPAAKHDYDRAVAAYDRANDLHKRGDELAADQALDEGLAAIASASERLAGRKR